MSVAAAPEVDDIAAKGLATIPESGDFLKVSRATIYSLMETGQLEYVKIGKCRRIPWCALHQLVERGLVAR